MTSDIESSKDDIKSQNQEARAKLRESFLKAINELNGEECSILTYEKSVLQATFSGWNVEGNEVLVQKLKTPANTTVESALLRTPDIIAIQFEKPLILP